MSCNFVHPAPIGVTQPRESDRRPIYKVIAGDDIRIQTKAYLHDGTPATPDNSIAKFTLQDQRFDTSAVWVGYWRDGIELCDDGIIEIRVPQSVSDILRRGSFLYSMVLSDLLGSRRRTVLTGSLLVEYEPTSPHHNIPYKS
jgi:hypothetical protein